MSVALKLGFGIMGWAKALQAREVMNFQKVVKFCMFWLGSSIHIYSNDIMVPI